VTIDNSISVGRFATSGGRYLKTKFLVCDCHCGSIASSVEGWPACASGQWVALTDLPLRQMTVVRVDNDFVLCEWPENGELLNGRFLSEKLQLCEHTNPPAE
jgi:hypothetical protein